jgi:hypothetical protein
MDSDEWSEELPLVVEKNQGSTEAFTAFGEDGILEAIRDKYSIKSCESEVMACLLT